MTDDAGQSLRQEGQGTAHVSDQRRKADHAPEEEFEIDVYATLELGIGSVD